MDNLNTKAVELAEAVETLLGGYTVNVEIDHVMRGEAFMLAVSVRARGDNNKLYSVVEGFDPKWLNDVNTEDFEKARDHIVNKFKRTGKFGEV